VGESNIFHGTLTEPGVVTLSGGRRLLVNRKGKVGERLGVLMRPERFVDKGANGFGGKVAESVYLGASFKLRLACDDGLELIVRRPARGKLPAPGQRLEVGIEPDAIHVF
jgi:putative spermidine/putrescine transport system ATP-binding protein